MTSPNVEGLDLMLAVRQNAETQADRLDQEAAGLEAKAAQMRTKATGLREMSAVAKRYEGGE